MGTNVWPNEPVPPVSKIEAFLSNLAPLPVFESICVKAL
jgi:hypothetical protein